MKKKEQGMVIVEFAIIAVALVIVLFTVMELGRLIWIWNTADEATRRGARVAAVCPIGDQAVPRVTVFADPGGGGSANSPILPGLNANTHVTVEYLDENGGTPPGGATFENTRYVRVSLSGYPVTLMIPFIEITINLPAFETTIPSESLGFVPDTADFRCLMP